MDIVDHVHGRQDDFKSKLLSLANDEIGQIVRSFAKATPAQRARAIERLSSIIGGIAELDTPND